MYDIKPRLLIYKVNLTVDKTYKFYPISGELNKTGTNVGNLIITGFGLIALSGAVFVTSKRGLG